MLFYNHDDILVSTTCWFERENPIQEKEYICCSATVMGTNRNSMGQPREAIFLPNNQTNRAGIFIHMGTSPAWSEGCIVIEEEEILRIWNTIHPKNAGNVTVIVMNNTDDWDC